MFSISELAAYLEVSESAIRARLRRRGIKPIGIVFRPSDGRPLAGYDSEVLSKLAPLPSGRPFKR